MGRYHVALCREIEQFAQQCGRKLSIDTIFFGGGTPSTYPDDLLLDMFGTLRKNFTFDETTEVSIEVNPGTVRSEQLELWKNIGINRVSIGVQSLKDSVLHSLNRLQKAHDVTWVISHAQKQFSAISIDLILGLPGVSHDEWKEIIHTVCSWPLKHISVYFLTVHEETPLYFKVKTKKVILPTDDAMVELYYWTRDTLAFYGFEQYEMSNFARPGYHSRHNSVYWDRKPYKGFGLGACSFDGYARSQNEKILMKYLEGIEQESSIVAYVENLTKEQEHLEKLMLSLRRTKGASWELLLEDLSLHEQARFKTTMAKLIDHKFVIEYDGRLQLTPKGLVVENEIITQLAL